MPGLGDLLGMRPVGDLPDAGQVRAHGEHERLAGDRDGRGLGGEGLVQGGIQAGQPARAEGGRPGVVVAVVDGDQRELAGQAGYADEPGERLGHHFVGEQRREGGGVGFHRAPPASWFGFSQMTVPPMPKPMHMVVMP